MGWVGGWGWGGAGGWGWGSIGRTAVRAQPAQGLHPLPSCKTLAGQPGSCGKQSKEERSPGPCAGTGKHARSPAYAAGEGGPATKGGEASKCTGAPEGAGAASSYSLQLIHLHDAAPAACAAAAAAPPCQLTAHPGQQRSPGPRCWAGHSGDSAEEAGCTGAPGSGGQSASHALAESPRALPAMPAQGARPHAAPTLVILQCARSTPGPQAGRAAATMDQRAAGAPGRPEAGSSAMVHL